MMLTTYFRLGLRMSGTVHLLPLHAFMAWRVTTLPFLNLTESTPLCIGVIPSKTQLIVDVVIDIYIYIYIIVIIFINCNWVDTRRQWLFYMYTKYDIGYC
jgi:hypothetical protein